MRKVLKDLACDEKELSILFTNDASVRDLNRHYRGKDKPTNVLSFPQNGDEEDDIETSMLGDIVISVDTAEREALEMGITPERRIMELLIHGFLHLMGYDHERSEKDENLMFEEEIRLLSIIMEE